MRLRCESASVTRRTCRTWSGRLRRPAWRHREDSSKPSLQRLGGESATSRRETWPIRSGRSRASVLRSLKYSPTSDLQLRSASTSSPTSGNRSFTQLRCTHGSCGPSSTFRCLPTWPTWSSSELRTCALHRALRSCSTTFPRCSSSSAGSTRSSTSPRKGSLSISPAPTRSSRLKWMGRSTSFETCRAATTLPMARRVSSPNCCGSSAGTSPT
mmetsp:Transcript_13124/g.39661  ORF Transcript_13124/g.39661 Transcript_13124/m.39661 type:complete len:213 (-) Transcript_13124:134-772(-)